MAEANQKLLEKLEQLNASVLDATSDVTPAEWEVLSVDENWPLGLLLSHIATGYGNSARWIGTLLEGKPLTVTGHDIGEANDKAEASYTPVGADELLARLNENMAALSRLVESLSEEQLALTSPMALVGGRDVTPSFLVDVLIRHTKGHLESFKMTLASVRDEITT